MDGKPSIDKLLLSPVLYAPLSQALLGRWPNFLWKFFATDS